MTFYRVTNHSKAGRVYHNEKHEPFHINPGQTSKPQEMTDAQVEAIRLDKLIKVVETITSNEEGEVDKIELAAAEQAGETRKEGEDEPQKETPAEKPKDAPVERKKSERVRLTAKG